MESWLAKAEVSLMDYVTTMLHGGHWPAPLMAPAEIEANVAHAADYVADLLLDLTAPCGYRTHGGMLACASLPGHLVRAKLADLIGLRGRTIAPNLVGAGLPRTEDGVRVMVIAEGKHCVVADLGFDVALDWRDVARRVLRDALLRSLTSCEDSLGFSWFRPAACHGPLQLPICVAIPASGFTDLPVPRRRRRA